MSFFDHPIAPRKEAPKPQLDPAEIMKRAVDRTKKFYGLTEDEVRAIGFDPEQYEAGRLEQLEWEASQKAEEVAELVDFYKTYVDLGQMTPGEAALLLKQDSEEAHSEFLKQWKATEAEDALAEGADLLTYASADEYEALHDQLIAEQAEAQRIERGDELGKQLAKQLDAYLPADHPLRSQVTQSLLEKAVEAGGIPLDTIEQAKFVGASVAEADASAAQLEEFRQRAEDLWRAERANRMRGPAMTQTAYNRAHREFVQNEIEAMREDAAVAQQAGPKAGASGRADVSETNLQHRPEITMDSGYREALRRSEEAAGVYRDDAGHEVRLAVAAGDALSAPSRHSNSSRPDLPDDWADEYGPSHL